MPLTPTLSPLGAAGTIGNSLDRSIGNTSSARRRGARSRSRAQRAAPTPWLSRSLELTGMIDAAEQDRTEVHGPGAAVTFFETNRFPGQHLVDEQSLAAPEDFSGLTHHADLPVIGIGDVGHTRRIRSRGGPIDLTRSEIADPLMRRTPTEPSFENCCTHGIRGLVFGSAFTRRSRGRVTVFFAAA